jgi:hypothetical protein
MEDQFHLYKSESPLPRDHSCQVWFNLVEQFSRRRLKCKKLSRLKCEKLTDEGQMPSNHKSSHGLWACE